MIKQSWEFRSGGIRGFKLRNAMHNGHREENMTFFKSLSSFALGAALLSSTAFAGEIVLN